MQKGLGDLMEQGFILNMKKWGFKMAGSLTCCHINGQWPCKDHISNLVLVPFTCAHLCKLIETDSIPGSVCVFLCVCVCIQIHTQKSVSVCMYLHMHTYIHYLYLCGGDTGRHWYTHIHICLESITCQDLCQGLWSRNWTRWSLCSLEAHSYKAKKLRQLKRYFVLTLNSIQ